MTNTEKILKTSQKHKLTHIGSSLSVLPILEEIYAEKGKEDKVLLCGAHSHLAHLIVSGRNPDLISKDIHCNREVGCDALGGSLGHAGGIAIGMALAGHKVYLVETDGAMGEGSCWEALRIMGELNLNIKVYVNANGYSAVAKVDPYFLEQRMKLFYKNVDFRQTDNTEEFAGVAGHYKKI